MFDPVTDKIRKLYLIYKNQHMKKEDLFGVLCFLQASYTLKHSKDDDACKSTYFEDLKTHPIQIYSPLFSGGSNR